MKKRSLSGIRATGDVHIGNYLGMLKPALAAQKDCECLYFIADLHALTSTRSAEFLRRKTYEIVATWIALGFDYKNNMIYRQSDLPMVTEFAWYLSISTGMGLLEKGHAYKDASASNREVNHGIFAYPVLMAADILMYDADLVPVGKDQKQHVEMARDMAGSFNALFGANIIKLPEVVIKEDVMLIPGLDGRKMSKSYDNYIALFDEEATLRKKVMSIKTDSRSLEEPKSLNDTLVGQLFALFATRDQYADLEKRMNAGGLGWGHAKQELFEAINAEVAPVRKTYQELQKDEQQLDQILQNCTERAFGICAPVLDRVRNAVGVQKYPYRLHKAAF